MLANCLKIQVKKLVLVWASSSDVVCCSGVCSSDEFRCTNENHKETQCVTITSRCDGKEQCSDGSDEIECDCAVLGRSDQQTSVGEPSLHSLKCTQQFNQQMHSAPFFENCRITLLHKILLYKEIYFVLNWTSSVLFKYKLMMSN